MNSKNLNVILLLGVIVLGLFLYLEKCQSKRSGDKDSIALVNALQDSVKHYKNKYDQSVATISVIQTESAKSFTRLKLMDDELKALQAVVKDYSGKLKAGNSVTNALIETVAKLNSRPTTIIQAGDTLITDSLIYVYPTYLDTITNEWITLESKMNRDTAIHNLKVQNKFSAIVGLDKGKPFVDLITDNPYTTVKQLRTYQVKMPKPKKFGIGINVSYGISDDFKPKPYIGLGVQYNILRL